MNRATLGIDAAWTAHHPSGVAVAVETASGWRLAGVAASYAGFAALAAGRRDDGRPTGSRPEGASLIRAAETLSGGRVAAIGVDMPLSLEPINGRRAGDNAISRAFAARRCATHSPLPERPGAISLDLCRDLDALGFRLCANAFVEPALMEVYPHAALVEWLGAPVRLPYKTAKAAGYWPQATPAERRAKLARVWRRIIANLETRIAGVTEALPPPDPKAPLWRWKASEDALDAIICAAVAIDALSGRAKPYGDATSAIWVPAPALLT